MENIKGRQDLEGTSRIEAYIGALPAIDQQVLLAVVGKEMKEDEVAKVLVKLGVPDFNISESVSRSLKTLGLELFEEEDEDSVRSIVNKAYKVMTPLVGDWDEH